MNANNISHDPHTKAWELLPWLANGTLEQLRAQRSDSNQSLEELFLSATESSGDAS